MLLWQCCCDSVVVTLLLWQWCCDSVVVTLLLWQCCCDTVVVTVLLWHCCRKRAIYSNDLPTDISCCINFSDCFILIQVFCVTFVTLWLVPIMTIMIQSVWVYTPLSYIILRSFLRISFNLCLSWRRNAICSSENQDVQCISSPCWLLCIFSSLDLILLQCWIASRIEKPSHCSLLSLSLAWHLSRFEGYSKRSL